MDRGSGGLPNVNDDSASQRQWEHCLQHASDLIASAELIIAGEKPYSNIAYHLGILALEEIGKSGMLRSRAAIGVARDHGWLNKRLDDHVFKLMWALWSPSFYGGRIDPQKFEEARSFARSAHARRVAGLYVDYGDDGAVPPPREVVAHEQVTSILDLARSLLEIERTEGPPVIDPESEDLEWFLQTTSEERGLARLLSKPFLDKHEELGGDTRAWVRWARDELDRIAEEERAIAQRELARTPSDSETFNPKWRMKIRLFSRFHTIRPKALNIWNDRLDAIKLLAVGRKKNELLLEVTIPDRVRVEDVFDYGRSQAALCLVALNVGCGGLIWFEFSSQTEKFYESLVDLEAPGMDVQIGRVQALANMRLRDQNALEEGHLGNALKGLLVFLSMAEEDASAIFGAYLQGLVLISKTDLHLDCAGQSKEAFNKALRNALSRFGDWDGKEASLLPSLHRLLAPLIKEEEHRELVLKVIQDPTESGEGALVDAMMMKRIADLSLASIADRLWPGVIQSRE